MNPLCIPVPPNGPCPVFARRPPTVGSTFSGGNRKPLWPPGESNPYTRRYWNLNPARLPIPPGSHVLRTVVRFRPQYVSKCTRLLGLGQLSTPTSFFTTLDNLTCFASVLFLITPCAPGETAVVVTHSGIHATAVTSGHSIPSANAFLPCVFRACVPCESRACHCIGCNKCHPPNLHDHSESYFHL